MKRRIALTLLAAFAFFIAEGFTMAVAEGAITPDGKAYRHAYLRRLAKKFTGPSVFSYLDSLVNFKDPGFTIDEDSYGAAYYYDPDLLPLADDESMEMEVLSSAQFDSDYESGEDEPEESDDEEEDLDEDLTGLHFDRAASKHTIIQLRAYESGEDEPEESDDEEEDLDEDLTVSNEKRL